MDTREPRFDEAFKKAFRMCLQVVRHDWRGLLAMGSQATLGMYVIRYLGQGGGAMGLVTGVVYAATLIGLLAWCMRACLGVLHPGAEGVQVTLDRYVWRMGLAWATTFLPAVVAASVLFNTGDPASALYIGHTVLAMAAIFVGFMLAILTSAQVTATGGWNPIATWRALKGGRVVAVLAVTLTTVGTMGVIPILLLLYVVAGLDSLLGALVSFPSFVLAHATYGLGLAAIGIGLQDTLTRIRPA